MSIYFSKLTNSFYDTELFSLDSIPSDKYELTFEEWQILLNAQAEGKAIGSDENGAPIVVSQIYTPLPQ